MSIPFPKPIKDSILTIYYIPECPFCKNTIELITKFNVAGKKVKYALYDVYALSNPLFNNQQKKDFFKKEILNHFDSWYLNDKVENINSHKTFPYVFLQGRLIGGYDDLKNILEILKLNNEGTYY